MSKNIDKKMEKSTNGNYAPAGVSIRNGPVTDEMDIDIPAPNGKRKARLSAGKAVNYNDAASSSEEDNKPLVFFSALSDISLESPQFTVSDMITRLNVNEPQFPRPRRMRPNRIAMTCQYRERNRA